MRRRRHLPFPLPTPPELIKAQPGQRYPLPPPSLPVIHLLRLLRLLLVLLLHLVHRLFRQLLPRHPLDHVLLPRPPVADPNQQARRRVHRDGAAQDDRRQRRGPRLVRYSVRAGAERDLQAAVEVEQARDGDHEAHGKGEVGLRLMRLVEGV